MGLPKSPRWLMLLDKQEEATELIFALYDLSPDDSLVNDEVYAISSSLHIGKGTGLREVFNKDPLKNSTGSGISLAVQILG